MPVKSVKQVFSIALILLLPVLTIAQLPKQKTIDSLLVLLVKVKGDTNKISILNKLSDNYYILAPKKGIVFGNKALKMAEKAGWKKGIAVAYAGLGKNYWAEYDFIRAQDCYGISLRIAREAGDKFQAARDLLCIGICYSTQHNTAGAIEYYKRSLKAYGDLGNMRRMSGCLGDMAIGYIYQMKYDSALTCYNQALRLSQRDSDKRAVGYFYLQIGVLYGIKKDFNEALVYEKISLKRFKQINDYEDIALAVDDIGNIYLEKKEYDEAITQYLEALKTLKNIKDSNIETTQADFYCSIGQAYYEWARNTGTSPLAGGPATSARYIQLAATALHRAVDIGKRYNWNAAIKNSLSTLSDIEARQGKFSKALATYKEYILYKDSANNSAIDQQYRQHELAFEYAKAKDSADYAERLKKQTEEQAKNLVINGLKQRVLYTIVIIVVLSLIVSYFVFRNRLQKISFKGRLAKDKAEAELKQALFENKLNDLTLASLKSQMNPHFIFNCLNSIKFYVEKNDTEAASLYITKFSKLIRNILDSARSEKVTLAEEIELIRLYLEMECMRLKEKLFYEFDIASDIDTEFIEVPPLLIQPYVENAIWHGLMNKEGGGTVNISIKTTPDEGYLIIKITDDGIGRKKAAELKKKSVFQHISHGMKLNNERIEIINAKYKTNTEVIISDLSDADNNPCGTTVTIKLLIQ